MSRIVKVNWNKMKEMSSSSLKNASEFEEARKNFLSIIKSLNECWEGIDYKNFTNNCVDFLNNLENDTIYFEKIGRYFELGSGKYNHVVENHYQNINKMNQEIMTEEDLFNIVNQSQLDMAGIKYE